MRRVSTVKICLAAGFGVAGLYAAELITGSYNTSLGYLAGRDSDGDRATVQGAGAGGEASGLVRTDLIGAAAGAYSTNLTDCVGIGYRALRNAGNMSNVVAIGTGALSNRHAMAHATWINGQFYASAQGNTFWIKANPNTPNTNAPIYFADGVLNLNASAFRFNGETAAGGGGSGGGEYAPILIGYDLYVDPVEGDDLYHGASPGSAKRTIDAAYSLVTSNDTTICLLPGVHASPTNFMYVKGSYYPPYSVHFVAPYGPSITVLDGGGERIFNASSNGVMKFSGCTFRDFLSTNYRRCVFTNSIFTNCVFEGDFIGRINLGGDYVAASNCSGIFNYCDLYSCVATNATFTVLPNIGYFAGAYSLEKEEQFASGLTSLASMSAGVFSCCDLYDSVIAPSYTNSVGFFAYDSRFSNCLIDVGPSRSLCIEYGRDGCGFVNTTVIGTNCVWGCTGTNSFDVARSTFEGCLIGLDGTNGVRSLPNLTGTVLTNAATVAAILGADYRPAVTNWRYRYNGYGSAAERAVRDSMLESIRAALEAAAN